MSHLYGVGLQQTVNSINLEIKLHLFNNAPRFTLNKLRKALQSKEQECYISSNDFEECLKSVGYILKKIDLQALQKYYACKQGICSHSFQNDFKTPLNARRLNLVISLFNHLNINNGQSIPKTHLACCFSTRYNQDVLFKRKSEQQVIDQFLNEFEGDSVTQEAFVQYYEDIGQQILSEEQFNTIIYDTWRYQQIESQYIDPTELKGLMQTIRYNLIKRSQGQPEVLLRKHFRELDSQKSEYLQLEQLQAILLKLDIQYKPGHTEALFQKINQNDNKFMEFERFVNELENNVFE